MRRFRLLRPDEIECRISEIDRNARYIKLLLYKTARTDFALLDEVIGPDNWQNDYKCIDGKMYCGIGIRSAEHPTEWTWKWNVGTESNMEAEKGQASDAMKRAGFALGLGTELYSAPEIIVWSDKCKINTSQTGKKTCYDRFDVQSIEYDEKQDIVGLCIINARTGEVVFSWRKGQKAPPPPQQHPQQPQGQQSAAQEQAPPPQRQTPPTGSAFRCADCGAEIPRNVEEYSIKVFGRPLCRNCQNKARNRQ